MTARDRALGVSEQFRDVPRRASRRPAWAAARQSFVRVGLGDHECTVDVGITEFRSQFGGGTDKTQFLPLAEIKLKEWDEIVSAAEKSKIDF